MVSGSGANDQLPVKGLKILLVEDDEVCRCVMEKVLIIHGMEVFPACSGEEALEIFGINGEFDIILMDIQLPGIDGIETTSKIRELSFNRIPVIAVTALADEWKKEKFFPEGFDGYLSKPVDIELLFEVIRTQIDHSEK